jgi:hypothetical protein
LFLALEQDPSNIMRLNICTFDNGFTSVQSLLFIRTFRLSQHKHMPCRVVLCVVTMEKILLNVSDGINVIKCCNSHWRWYFQFGCLEHDVNCTHCSASKEKWVIIRG